MIGIILSGLGCFSFVLSFFFLHCPSFWHDKDGDSLSTCNTRICKADITKNIAKTTLTTKTKSFNLRNYSICLENEKFYAPISPMISFLYQMIFDWPVCFILPNLQPSTFVNQTSVEL